MLDGTYFYSWVLDWWRLVKLNWDVDLGAYVCLGGVWYVHYPGIGWRRNRNVLVACEYPFCDEMVSQEQLMFISSFMKKKPYIWINLFLKNLESVKQRAVCARRRKIKINLVPSVSMLSDGIHEHGDYSTSLARTNVPGATSLSVSLASKFQRARLPLRRTCRRHFCTKCCKKLLSQATFVNYYTET